MGILLKEILSFFHQFNRSVYNNSPLFLLIPKGFDVFNLLSPKEISYIRAMLRRGERITKQPRIRLSTIHAAKGGEATNVVLLTDLTTRVYKNYQSNPDDENRVFYVGLTRTKENLYLIEPQTTRCFQL